jgi:uncharacterized membrane protein
LTQTNSRTPPLYIALELIGFVLFGVAIYELSQVDVVTPVFLQFPYYQWVFLMFGFLSSVPLALHHLKLKKSPLK